MSSPTVSKTSGQPIVGAVGSGAGGDAGVNVLVNTFDTAPIEPPAAAIAIAKTRPPAAVQAASRTRWRPASARDTESRTAAPKPAVSTAPVRIQPLHRAAGDGVQGDDGRDVDRAMVGHGRADGRVGVGVAAFPGADGVEVVPVRRTFRASRTQR